MSATTAVSSQMHPGDELLLKIWCWLSAHRKTRALLIYAGICTVCMIVNMNGARADDSDSGTTSTLFLPFSDVTDSHGVPVDKFTTLPLDNGRLTYPIRLIRGVVLGLGWLLYLIPVLLCLALTNFVLGFTWLDWVASPFTLLADSLHRVLGQTELIGLGMSVSGLVIAWGFLRGRKGSAFAEVIMVALVGALIFTPLGNPSDYMTDWLKTSNSYGQEAGNATLSDVESGNSDTGDSLLSGQIIDLTLRDPYLTISFGSDLEGSDCSGKFDDLAKKDDADAEKIRKKVLSCDGDLKKNNETDNFLAVGFLFMFALGTTGLLAMLYVFLFFLVKDVLLALMGLLNIALKGYLAVFPGSARYQFVNAIAQTLVNVVMVFCYIWAISVFIWVVGQIVESIGSTAMMIGNLMFALILLVMIVTFFRMKKQGKSLGEALSRALGSSGLSKASPGSKPSSFGPLKAAASRAAVRGSSNLGRAAAHGSGRLAKAGARWGTGAALAAATGGTSLAGAVATRAGFKAATFLARPPKSKKSPMDKQRNKSGAVPMPGGQQANPNAQVDLYQGPTPQAENTAGEAPSRQGRMPEPEPASGQSLPHHEMPRQQELAGQGTGAGQPDRELEPASAVSPVQQQRQQRREEAAAAAAAAGASAAAARNARQSESAAGPMPQTSTDASAPKSGASQPTRTPKSSAAATGGSRSSAGGYSPKSTLPSGQYGSTRLNRDGSSNKVLVGEVVDTIPDGTRRVKTWNSPQTPRSNKWVAGNRRSAVAGGRGQ